MRPQKSIFLTRRNFERADLKLRQAEAFNRLKTEWEVWDKPMLPQKPGIQPYRHPGEVMADHYGLVNSK